VRANDLKQIALPDEPGVYFFIGLNGKVLYIGKATSLRDRVRSYFNTDVIKSRGPLIKVMVDLAYSVDYIKADSVLEALILEANLIKKHTPKFNTRDKDDKSFNYVVITKEEYPRVLVVRGKELAERFYPAQIKYTFGPFPHGLQFKQAMKIVRKIFPFYDMKMPVRDATSRMEKGRILFNQQIGLYPKNMPKDEYAWLIQHIKLFFEGRKKDLIKSLEQEMKSYAREKMFEKAAVVKRRIFALKHIQDVALIKRELKESIQGQRRAFRIEAYDVAHTSGTDMVGGMVVSENGMLKPAAYRRFKVQSVSKSDDTAALKEVLERRLTHSEWQYPFIVVVDGGVAQRNAAEKVLQNNGYAIPVVSVVKGVGHKPRRILGNRVIVKRHENTILLANAEAHRFALSYHRRLREKL